jgi:hypothetical protein
MNDSDVPPLLYASRSQFLIKSYCALIKRQIVVINNVFSFQTEDLLRGITAS